MEKLTENMIRWAKSKLGSTEYAGWCLAFEHNGIGFEKALYSDAGDDDEELVLNAKYRLCR